MKKAIPVNHLSASLRASGAYRKEAKGRGEKGMEKGREESR